MIEEQNKKIVLLREQVKFKRDQYLSKSIEFIQRQEQIINKNAQITNQKYQQEQIYQIHQECSPQANQLSLEKFCNIILQEDKDNYKRKQYKYQRQANDIQKQVFRMKQKDIIKRILNNMDEFSQRFIEVIHKVDFNTQQIVTIERVDTSSLKLNRQFSWFKSVEINKYSQILLIKIDIDQDQLYSHDDWVIRLEEVKNIGQIQKETGYNKRLIYKLLRAIQCKYCPRELYNCDGFKKHKYQVHFLDKLRLN